MSKMGQTETGVNQRPRVFLKGSAFCLMAILNVLRVTIQSNWKSHTLLWDAKWVSHFGKGLERFLIKFNIHSPYDPAIRPIGIYPREIKTSAHKKICTQTFIVPY